MMMLLSVENRAFIRIVIDAYYGIVFYTHCLGLDLNDQMTSASSDDGFIYKKQTVNEWY
jgi:hypothetical protein